MRLLLLATLACASALLRLDAVASPRQPIASRLQLRAPLRLCADGPPTAEAEGSTPAAEADTGAPAKETLVEALQRVFVSEFGAQVLALTLAFAAFIAWSTVALGDDDFWGTPF